MFVLQKDNGTMLEKLESMIYENVIEYILNRMPEIIEKSKQKNGTLGGIFFKSLGYQMPKHPLNVRFGRVLEISIRRFLNTYYGDAEPYFREELTLFFKRKVQLDVANFNGSDIICCELKTDINLDTGKARSVYEWFVELNRFFSNYYTRETYGIFVVSLVDPYEKDIINLKPILSSIRQDYVLGYVEFFKLFGIDVSPDVWEGLITKFGNIVISAHDETLRIMGQ